jgi:hypothetical protein
MGSRSNLDGPGKRPDGTWFSDPDWAESSSDEFRRSQARRHRSLALDPGPSTAPEPAADEGRQADQRSASSTSQQESDPHVRRYEEGRRQSGFQLDRDYPSSQRDGADYRSLEGSQGASTDTEWRRERSSGGKKTDIRPGLSRNERPSGRFER